MKTSIRLTMGAAALALLLQASSPAKAFLWGLTEGNDCSQDWPKWKIVADGVAYALWKATCMDKSGTGSNENLGTSKQAGKKGWLGVAGYGSDPKKGFGSDIPVTLPADRRPPPGTSTGIAIGNRTLPTIPTQNYFRPR